MIEIGDSFECVRDLEGIASLNIHFDGFSSPPSQLTAAEYSDKSSHE
jgi:hypothetical protein